MISVVIPLYNKERQIASTLQSVFDQTFTDYEIVVVDDGSTDGSAAVVEAIADPRVRLIRQSNAGVSAARNRGIAEARGKYIALLDADDQWKPDFLATIAHLIEKYPQCDVFATRYDFSDEFGKHRDSMINALPFSEENGILSNYFEVASCSDSPLWTSIVCASKEAFQAVGGFPTGVTSGEDLLTWAKLACRFDIAFSRKVCATYYTPTTGPTGVVPADLKSTNDYVGTHLEELNSQFPDKGVAQYIAYWYKMRGVINLHRLNRRAAVRCAMKSLRYNPGLFKSWAIIPIATLPAFLIRKIIY